MKIILATAFLLGTAAGLYARPLISAGGKETLPPIALTCTQGKIDHEFLSKTDYVDIHLRCVLENKSAAPIIFLQAAPGILSARIVESHKPQRTLADEWYSVSSFALSENDWKQFVTEHDRPRPPEGKTYSLAAGAKLEFDHFARFGFPSPDVPMVMPGVDPFEKRDLAFMQNRSPLTLNVRFETWSILPLIINGKDHTSRQREFGQKLRRQWQKDGYLWLDEIDSEPIEIDLRSLVDKE